MNRCKLILNYYYSGEVMVRTKIVGGGSKKRYRSRSTSVSSQGSFSSGSYSGKWILKS